MIRRLVLFLLLVATSPLGRAASGITSDYTFEGLWDDNVTNSDRDEVRGTSIGGSLDLKATGPVSVSGDDTLVIEGKFWGRYFQDTKIKQLSTALVTLSGSLEHKFGVGAYVPAATVLVSADGGMGAAGRAGLGAHATVTLRQRLSPGTRVELGYEQSTFAAKQAVFDRDGEEGLLRFSFDPTAVIQLSIDGHWRSGDVVSYAIPPRADLLAEARAFLPVSSFETTRTAYSVRARTLSGGLAIALRSGPGSSITLRAENRNTSRGALSYRNRVISLVFVGRQ